MYKYIIEYLKIQLYISMHFVNDLTSEKYDNKSSLTLSLQMPSVTTGDNAVHSSSPDLGSAPSDGLKQVLGVIDKKVRNMEKKKVT